MLRAIGERIINHWRGGVFTGVGVITGCGCLIFLLRTQLRSDTVHQTVDVASEALGDLRLRQQAIVLSKEVVHNILRHEESLELLKDLLYHLLQQQETKNNLMMLLRNVLDDPYFQETTKKFVVRILGDAWIMERLTAITQNQARDLTQNENTRAHMTEFLKLTLSSALESQELREKATSAGREIVWGVFWK